MEMFLFLFSSNAGFRLIGILLGNFIGLFLLFYNVTNIRTMLSHQCLEFLYLFFVHHDCTWRCPQLHGVCYIRMNR